MHTYAWTFNVKSVMRETGEKKENGRNRFRQVYEINEVFPKVLSGVEIKKVWSGGEPGKGSLSREIIGPAGEEEAINKVWSVAKSEVQRLLTSGKNLMGVVVCVEKEEIGMSVCSAYEEKFDLKRGIEMSQGRLLKTLKRVGKYESNPR